jgi:hypothetical protein
MLEAERKGHKKFYSPGCLSLTNVESGCKTDFKITTAGLYAFKIPIEGVEMLQTVEENQQMFTPRQIAQAKQARKLYEMVGRPSYNDFIAIIKNNLLLNSKIMPRDVLHAEAIFGKDLGALQGKTTRKRPDRVITDYIHVPDDIMRYHNKVVLAIDVMTIAEMPFLITTSRDIQFTTIEKLSSKVAPMLAQGILKVANLYKRRGFFVDLCLGDNEFEGVRATLQNHGIKLNTCAPNEHVPEVERKIRTVNERVRRVITNLPFNTLPPAIIVHAVVFSVMWWLNYFPPKGGISKTISPQTIVTGMPPDAEKHCQIPFGAYAQVHVEPNPSNDAMTSQTVGGISLGPTGNLQGTYHFLSLLTGRVIKARSFTPLPMPKEVVRAIETMNYVKPKEDETESLQSALHFINLPTTSDDVSLEVDSGISTKELADILEEFEAEVDANDDVNSINNSEGSNKEIELPEVEGSDEENNLPNMDATDDQGQPAEDVEQNVSGVSEQEDGQIETDIIEGYLQPNSPRTHYVTRSGRPV